MKLYIKRVFSDADAGFAVYDELGQCKYNAAVSSEKSRQHILVTNSDDMPVSEIYHKNFLLRYFTIRCMSGNYLLLPIVKDCFSFKIYGSQYRFAGDISSGSFSLFDVDNSPVMTQKKCWSKYGDAYELNIFVPDDEMFALAVALCAVLFISAAEESAVLSG